MIVCTDEKMKVEEWANPMPIEQLEVVVIGKAYHAFVNYRNAVKNKRKRGGRYD